MENLLRAALCGHAVRPEAASERDATRFLELTLRHGVQPLLVHTLQQAGTLDAWPETLRVPLLRGALAQAAVEELRRAELRRVLDSLAGAGVRPLLLKGAGLAYTHYPHPGLRPRRDSDMLVRERDVPAVRRALRELHYREPDHLTGDLVTHQVQFVKEDLHRVQHALDVHWKVSNPQPFANLLSYEELNDRAIRVPALGEHARTLAPVHALLLACLHRVAHHSGDGDLIWVYDIHLLVTGLDEARLDEFARLARQKELGAVCADGLAQAERWFGTRVPSATLAEFGAQPPSEGSRVYLNGQLRPLDILMGDVRGLDGWRARLQLLREHALPPSSYMLKTYSVRSRALLPVLYTHRLLRGVVRLFRPLES